MEYPAPYIRRNLMHGLKQAGFSKAVSGVFADAVIGMINHEAALPNHFFDIPRTIRIFANREGLSPKKAADILITHPEKMLEVFDLPVREKKRWMLKYHPTRTERMDAAIAVRSKYGSLPNSRNCKNGDHECLPENSIGWTYILKTYYHNKGIKLSDDVADYERARSNGPDPAMPSDYRIFQRALIFMARNNALPSPVKKRMTGKNSPYWEDIHVYLERRGMSLGSLIAEQQDKKIKGTAHLRQSSILPDNDVIALWAVGIRRRSGLIPPDKEIFTTLDGRKITAGKLKERLVAERNTTLVTLMDEFENANPVLTPNLNLRTVFIKSAAVIIESGAVPDQRKNNIAVGEYTALAINKHFTQGTVYVDSAFRLNKRQMRNYREFLLATGLAEKTKGGELIPAPREKIERLLAAYAL